MNTGTCTHIHTATESPKLLTSDSVLVGRKRDTPVNLKKPIGKLLDFLDPVPGIPEDRAIVSIEAYMPGRKHIRGYESATAYALL